MKIIGAGLLHGALYQLITDLQIEDHVVLPGQLDDVSAELRQATCLVHPSEVEGCPNVIMEAMASGRAVVAVDSGDVTALVEHGKTGYVVAPEDDAALARYVTLLLTNPDLSRKMGEAAREKANREFGLDRLVRETLSAYRAAGWKDE
ncbi:MAG: glycosyltransferase [Chloracidobacterium sp.]|nr:glycosyltransferase [Chloracidobacterium sp.]